MDSILLIASFAICASLFYLHHRRTVIRAYAAGLAAGRLETQQLKYAEGYSTGVYEGRLKAQLEQETREYKAKRDYDTGYNDALAAVAGMNYTAMLGEATTKLSA